MEIPDQFLSLKWLHITASILLFQYIYSAQSQSDLRMKCFPYDNNSAQWKYNPHDCYWCCLLQVEGDLALHLAARLQNIEIVKRLVENGAKVDAQNVS